MSMLLVLTFIGPISLFYHPHPMHNGVCYAVPGTIAALYCPVNSEKPNEIPRDRLH